jgi:hypothetical protein
MKNNGKLIKVSFSAAFLLTITGAFFKILHWNYAEVFIAIGILSNLFFISLSTIEVLSCNTITKVEKTMWINGLILLSPIVGFIYIFSARKRIIKN